MNACFFRAVAAVLVLSLIGVSGSARARPAAWFDWFEYRGQDRVFETPLPQGHYRNPVLAGFHADPGLTRVGDRYYLVNSSFTHFPGIPVFESRDLVHWKLISHVIDRPSQLHFDGLGMSRGVFAPTIQHHDGIFYVVTTAVDAGGNFIATAKDPAGPWSDPIWLPGIEGIDPSLFFDDDGRVYLLNNGEPAGTPRYDGHRAIWMQEIDLAAFKPIGPRRVLLDGGVDPASNPIWIEGPHVFKRDGWYYLTCAEGGTGPQHSQVVLRSRDAWGPYQPYAHNPILTQRDLPDDRELPVTNAGHADLVEAADGTWWAVFLASRNYDRRHYNTGRETFLLPVHWRDGWPVILQAGRSIPMIVRGPSFMADAAQSPETGNFRWHDAFDRTTLDDAWRYVRVPKPVWADLTTRPGWLRVPAFDEGLETLRNPAFLARRQQHLKFDAATAMAWPDEGVEAGIAAFQNERYWYFLGVRRAGKGGEVFLQRSRDGMRETIATQPIAAADTVTLQIAGDGGRYDFGFDRGDGIRWLARDQEGTMLSTDVAGGFVGVSLGPHARRANVTRDSAMPSGAD